MPQEYTYFLAPNFRFKPGGPIALGNLIADPFRPHRALTKVSADVLASTYPRVETAVELARTISKGSSHSLSGAAWTKFLEGAAARVGGERGGSTSTTYTTSSLETSYFVEDPSPEEIDARVAEPRVTAYMKSDRLVPGLRRPVYLVTGVMVAHDFGFNADETRSRALELEVSADAPTPVGDVSVGASFKNASEKSSGDSWTAANDIIFAYQLLKIESKGWRERRIKVDELRSKHGVYSTDGNDDLEEDDSEELGPVEASVAGAESLSEETASEVAMKLENGDRLLCVHTLIGGSNP